MKTLNEVNSKLDQLYSTHYLDGKERKKAEKEVGFLTIIKHYLETCPNTELLEKQLKFLQGQLLKITDGFEAWCSNQPYNEKGKLQREYNSLNEVSKKRNQIKALKFLLE